MDKTREDPLIQTIVDSGLISKEDCAEMLVGKSRTHRNINLCLGKITQLTSQTRWLRAITGKLINLQFVLQSESGTGMTNNIPDFHYIPCPGINNGERIAHPEEIPHYRNRVQSEIGDQDISNSPLLKSPEARSREMTWMIPYKTSKGTRKLLFLLTFDPHHLANLRINPLEVEEAKQYWEAAAINQGQIHPKDNPPYLFLYGLTSLHEWMNCLLPKEGNEKPEWERQIVSQNEREKASILGLDIYYTNDLVAFGWSTLEKPKGRERSRVKLQQLLSKKVVLFDPIYGKSGGDVRLVEPTHRTIYRKDLSHQEITARAMWDNIILQAYSTGSSDIHLEPQAEEGKRERNLILSIRKDNELNFFAKCDPAVGENVVRYALESSGVIRSNTEVDQDGRKSWTHPKKGTSLDLRISVTPMPESNTQEVVIRLLDNSRLKAGLGQINQAPEELEIWRQALAIEEALILVSGPTGSGKSSTLFSAICDIHNRDPNRKITSIEDPIEYTFPFKAPQHEINLSSGMTFPRYIRRMLRNDIDTLLVGEIRDAETLYATLQAALTGHQILSTIHAKSAADTILRMLEFKPEPYILSEVVKLVVAQRLAATPCPICTKILTAREAEEEIHKNGGIQRVLAFNDRWHKKYPSIKEPRWKKSEGCPTCRFTGAQGKTAVQEFLIVNNDNKKYLKTGNVAALQASMQERELYNLETTAWKLAWMGKISIKEAGKLTDALETSAK